MKRLALVFAALALSLVVAGQANAYDHWVDDVVEGTYTVPGSAVVSGELFGVDFGPISLGGSTVLWNSDAYGDPAGDPGHLNRFDTEIVSMTLGGFGVTLTAGDGTGNGLYDGPLYSPGAVIEDPTDPALGLSTLSIAFDVTIAGAGTFHSHDPGHVIEALLTGIPPIATHIPPPATVTWLYPGPAAGPDHSHGSVGYLTGTHTTFPEPATFVMLVIGGLVMGGWALIRRRRRRA